MAYGNYIPSGVYIHVRTSQIPEALSSAPVPDPWPQTTEPGLSAIKHHVASSKQCWQGPPFNYLSKIGTSYFYSLSRNWYIINCMYLYLWYSQLFLVGIVSPREASRKSLSEVYPSCIYSDSFPDTYSSHFSEGYRFHKARRISEDSPRKAQQEILGAPLHLA